MKSKIINYIRAGYPGLYLVSHEEQRVALKMTRIAQDLKYPCSRSPVHAAGLVNASTLGRANAGAGVRVAATSSTMKSASGAARAALTSGVAPILIKVTLGVEAGVAGHS